jgi:hypothetical protein
MTMVMGQTDSLVSALKQDQRYIGLCAAETLGYFSLAHSSSKASDLGYLFGGQQLLESCDASNVDGMLFVADVIYPFEIGDNIVRFDTVNMVDHRKTSWVWNESRANKSVNVDGLAFSKHEKIELAVSEFIDAMPQYLAVASLRATRPHSHSVETSYSTEIADFVEADEIRDGSPLFIKSDIHVAGCPSGYDGLAIKDPLHASTSAGPPIMDEASSTYNRRLPFP